MKKISFILILIIFSNIILYSCKKDATTEHQENKIENNKFGIYHNEILEAYYQRNSKNINMNLDQKVSFVDAQLDSIFPEINEGDFEKIVNQYPGLKDYLIRIENEEANAEMAYSIINDLFLNNQITEKEKDLLYQIGQAYENHIFDFPNLKIDLENIKRNVVNDSQMDIREKYNLESVLNVTISSIEYWEQNTGNRSIMSAPWYEKDFFGAMLGIQSGLVGWASTFGGPAGGATALVGSAAVASMID